MFRLTKYYFWFFLFCIIYTMLTGVVAAVIPNELAMVLLTVPYLAAMVSVLYIFLKQQRRAPTATEKKHFTIAYILLFWLFNIFGILSSLVYFAQQDQTIWDNFLAYMINPQFILIVLAMVLVLSIPLVLITLWFYGKQAQRMAGRMFG